MNTCAHCRAEFSPRRPDQQYCSAVCRNRAKCQRHYSRIVSPASHPQISSRACQICGSTFRRTYSKQRTCGRACGAELRRREGWVAPSVREGWQSRANARETATAARRLASAAAALLPVQCPTCGELFVRSARQQRYCTPICRPYSTVAGPRVCNGCGKELPPGRGRCDPCKEQTRKAAKRRKRRAEKARRRGVLHEPYTLAEIAERDGHKCQLCKKRVPMDKAVPHPLAPTIDHVLPIARGGDDTRANVQLAHFECNWRKGDGGTQQLALVG